MKMKFNSSTKDNRICSHSNACNGLEVCTDRFVLNIVRQLYNNFDYSCLFLIVKKDNVEK